MKNQGLVPSIVSLAMILLSVHFTHLAEAAPSAKDQEAIALAKLKAIRTSTIATAQKLMRTQIATLVRIEKILPSALSKKDEALCLALNENIDEVTPASEACERMAEAVQALADKEFAQAGLVPFDNEYETSLDQALEDVYQAKFALTEAGGQASAAYLEYEGALVDLICKASVQFRGSTAFVAGSMLVYSTAAELNSKRKLTIAGLVHQAHKQVELVQGLAEYVLGKN
jgi:hypothetical protein